MKSLKLVAFDKEDLAIVSANAQDALIKVGDMAYQKRQKRFAAIINRFDWAGAESGARRKRTFQRRVAALRFERVLGVSLQNVRLGAKDAVVSLLAIRFEEADPPGGYITLVLAGGGAIRLHVECIEAELRDLGAAWLTRAKPEHKEEGGKG